jgi:cyclic-di-GMP phosphodiesterase, flagellum assembly factor TipF
MEERSSGYAAAPGAATWFIAACMVLISASLAAVIYLQFDLSLAEAGWIGFATLMLMVLAEFFSARSRERAAVDAQIGEIDAIAAQLGQEMTRIEQRFADLQSRLPQRIEDGIDARTSELHAELQVLEERFLALENSVATLKLERISTDSPAEGDGSALDGMGTSEAIEVIRRAIDDSRIEVFLQPTVMLPQRRVRHYEALTRLRGEDGRTIVPGAFIPIAEPAGLMPRIDNILLSHCVQIVQRMMRRNPDIAVFCNISARSLADTGFFPQFLSYVERNRELNAALVFELPQAVLEHLGPIEQTGLDSLADLGFRFSVDHVRNLDIDGPAYAARRVRFVKVDAGTLLNPPSGAHIHVTDLSRLLARSGIELIASHVETEAQLVDLLDYDIHLGQGHLFSPPRPVRSEILGDTAQAVQWAHAS